MKNGVRLTAIAIAALMMIGLFAGCSNAGAASFYHHDDLRLPASDTVVMDLSLEMVPLTASPAMFNIRTPRAPGTRASKNAKAEIDHSNAEQGYVMIRFVAPTTKRLKVRVTGPSGIKYDYDLKPNNVYEVYPLSDGNGRYTVGVFEQVEGTRYATANSVSFNVTLENEFAPFLHPNQYVNFSQNSTTVAKAAELIGNANDLTAKISAVYNFVISNLTYDREFAAEVGRGMHTGYVPDVDAVLKNGKGICFDYAALMAAMLRSQGIPTKLIVGYAGTAYHAWIDVYSEEEGWINSVIFFDGTEWKLMDPTFASSGGEAATMRLIGDGKTYRAVYQY